MCLRAVPPPWNAAINSLVSGETVCSRYTRVTRAFRVSLGALCSSQARDHWCTDPEAFCNDGNEAIQRARLGEAQAGELLARVFRLCLKYEVRLEPRVALKVIAVAVLEGLRQTLAPDCNMLTAALPSVLTAVPMKTAGSG
ncbi:unnamed protein product [Ectocarpus sp. 4 AP-2014]